MTLEVRKILAPFIMTTDSIEKLIDSINDGTGNDRIYQRPLMDNVNYAKVWTEYPTGESCNEEGYLFYFINSEGGTCIAAILVMGTVDLHVFVKQEYRRQGIMSRALSNVVLPHLFLNDRKIQRATFNSTEGKRLLEKVGFTILDEKNAEIKKEKVSTVIFPEWTRIPFSKERMEVMQKRACMATALLRMVHDELSTYSREERTEGLGYIIEECDTVFVDIEDEWWDCRPKTE